MRLDQLEGQAREQGLLLRLQVGRPLGLWSLRLAVAKPIGDSRLRLLGEIGLVLLELQLDF